MEIKKLDHKYTGKFSKLILDYLECNKDLKQFYNYEFDMNQIEEVILDKSKEATKRELLVEVLLNQNEAYFDQFKLVETNIKSLKNKNSFTITTGHQLCIFGGPLYFITKVISVIKTTKLLSEKYPNYSFIPVFWLASEDHGRGEVSSINLFGKKLSWENSTTIPTGNISTTALKKILNSVKEILGDSDNAKELIQIFENAYDGTKNLAQATRYYLTHLFGDNGLVILDGDDKSLKQQLIPIIKEEIRNYIGKNKVDEVTKKLGALGYSGQVYPREINFFRLSKEGRMGIEKNSVTIEEIEEHPERFSPNVIYRPLYQELVLPNLAYIGGPGETAYWLQLKGLFEYFKINLPMLIVRDNSLFIPKMIQKKMDKLNLTVADLFKDKLTLENEMTQNLASFDLTLAMESEQLAAIFDTLTVKAEQVDKSLVQSIEGEKTKQLKSLDGISKKLIKAEKKNQEDSLNQLNAILDKLFPEGSLQERHDNFMSLYLKFGHHFFEMYEETFNPFDKKFTVIIEE